MAFSPDGKRVAAYGGDFNGAKLYVRDIVTHQEAANINPQHRALVIDDLSPDGRLLAMHEDNNTPKIELWDLEQRRVARTLAGHTGWLLSVAFSPNGRNLISAGRDTTVRIWDVNQGMERSRLDLALPRDFRAEKIALSPDGTLAAVLSRPYPIVDPSGNDYPPPQVDLYDLRTQQRIFTHEGLADFLAAPVFSPDNRLMVMQGGTGSLLVETESRKIIGQLKDALGPYAFSPDGTLLATVQKGPAGQNRTVSLWHTDPVEIVGTLKMRGSQLVGLAFSPDGTSLAAIGYTTIWDVATLQEVGRFPAATVGGQFSPDSRMLAIQGMGTVYLWDVAQRALIGELPGHAGPVYQMRFSRDGYWLVTGGGDYELWDDEDGTVLVWEAIPPTAVGEEEESMPTAFSLSPNYPNPFNPSTTIRFALPANAQVELVLYNLAGQQVATLVSGQRVVGSYSVMWDGRDDQGRELASGVYLYRLQVGTQVETRKLLLLR